MPEITLENINEHFNGPYFQNHWNGLSDEKKVGLLELIQMTHGRRLDWFETDNEDIRVGRKNSRHEDARPVLGVITFVRRSIRVSPGRDYDSRRGRAGGFEPFIWGDGSNWAKRFVICVGNAAASSRVGRDGYYPNHFLP